MTTETAPTLPVPALEPPLYDSAKEETPAVNASAASLADDKKTEPDLHNSEKKDLLEPIELNEKGYDEEFADVDERKLLWKMDLLFLPFLGLCQVWNFLDRINIANANLAGLTAQLKLTPDQYGWCLSIFFFGYITCEIPSNLLLKKFSPSRWISRIMVTWSIVIMAMAGVSNYSGLLACRFFLGVGEAGMLPAIIYYLSFWYKREELGRRVGAIIGAVTVAGMIGGLLATGIQSLEGASGLHAWQYIFIIEGIPAFLFGVICWFYLPDFPDAKNAAKWFTPSERKFLTERLRRDYTNASEATVSLKQFFSGILDPKIWLFSIVFFAQSLPVFTISFFLPTIIAAMNISPVKAINQLLTVPVYAVGLLLTLILSQTSDRLRDRFYHNIGATVISIIGFILLATVDPSQPGVLYFSTMLGTGVFASAGPLLAWSNENVVGTTRSAFASALIIMCGNLSGVLATSLYKDAPLYRTSHWINVGFLIGSIFVAFGLRFLLKYENKKLDAVDKNVAKEEFGENPEFRYKY